MVRRKDVVWQVLIIGFLFWVFGAMIPLLGHVGAPSVIARYVVFEGTAAKGVPAALVEPFVTKLFPALAVVMLASRPQAEFPGVVQRGLAVVNFPAIDLDMVVERPFTFGAYGGFAFGVLEAVGKVIEYDVGVTSGLILTVLLHVTTGILVAGVVFATVRMDREWVVGVGRGAGLALAIVLHVAWNTGLNVIVIRGFRSIY